MPFLSDPAGSVAFYRPTGPCLISGNTIQSADELRCTTAKRRPFPVIFMSADPTIRPGRVVIFNAAGPTVLKICATQASLSVCLRKGHADVPTTTAQR